MTQFRSAILAAALCVLPWAGMASSGGAKPEPIDWSFDGVFGKRDTASVQRGLQVYREVCAACHGLQRVAFRQLTDVGFPEDEVKALAAEYTVSDGPNDEGEMFDRPGRPSDKFPAPYANEKAARAMQNGAYPPDLSLIIKARPDGANYVHALLTGYGPAPAYRCEEVMNGKCVAFDPIGNEEAIAAEAQEKAAMAAQGSEKTAAPTEETVDTVGQVFRCSDIEHGEETDGATGEKVAVQTCREMGANMHYNPYFPGKQIAMPQPISDEQVTYQDGTAATQEQISRDIVNFLQWAAEPEMEARKRMGIKVMIFLAAMTGFFYAAKKRIWSRIDH